MRALLLGLLTGTAATAQTPMTADDFERAVQGQTVTYGYSDGSRGTAQYGPGRSLRWAFEGDACFDGFWFPRDEELCFAFEDGRLSACWLFTLGPDGIRGTATERASGTTEPLTIFETARSSDPLPCPGPDIGV